MSPRERRTILAGLFILLAVGLVFRVIPWFHRSAVAMESRADLAVGMSSRAREALAADPLVRDSLRGRGARLVASAGRFLDGGSAAEAAASLGGMVAGAASVRHVRILRQEPRPDSIASIFRRVQLKVEVEGDARGLAGWLADLEESGKLIRVRQLSLTSPEPAAPSTEPERLRAEAVIEAWATRRGAR